MVPRAMLIVGVAIFWVLLGLIVFFVAIRGGPRGAREALYSESRSTRTVLQIAIVAAFAFGLVVPALVLAFNGAHKSSVGPGGSHLSAQQQKGRHIFAETCAFCHTLSAANAVGRTGPNLDALIPQINESGRKALVLSSIETGFAGRYGQMPAGIVQGHEAQQVASFVAEAAGH
jgi:mono/diheme cytochrome c family protein